MSVLSSHGRVSSSRGRPEWFSGGDGVDGAEAAGRDTASISIPRWAGDVDDDPDVARDMIRPMLALYLGGMGTRQVNFYNRLARRPGFTDAAERTQEAYLSGDVGAAVDGLPDELVDALTVCGAPEDVAERFEAYERAGATRLILGSTAQALADLADQLRRFTEIVGL